MRDNRRARLILALLLLTAFTLITLDYRSGSGGPLRAVGNAIFGPVERAVTAVTRPIGRFFTGLGHLNSYQSENDRLRAQNEQLTQQLRLTDQRDAHLASAQALLDLAGRAQFRIVPARVVGIGSSLGFEWTATVDVGSDDGVRVNQTVISGAGLVGKTEAVGPTTSTVLLAKDPEFTAGARLEGTQQIGHVDGGGYGPMTLTLLSNHAQLSVGDRLVSYPSIGNRPFVPEVPIGRVTSVATSSTRLSSTASVAPYVDFTALDMVGVVVAAPRTLPRDSLLPPSPTPSPAPSPSGSPPTQPAVTPSGRPSASRTP